MSEFMAPSGNDLTTEEMATVLEEAFTPERWERSAAVLGKLGDIEVGLAAKGELFDPVDPAQL